MKKVVLSGPVLSRSGYGEHARYMFRAIMSRPDLYDLYVLPTGWGASSWIHDNSEDSNSIHETIKKTQHVPGLVQGQLDPNYFDISLQVGIPNEWNKIAKYNIGVTAAVETTKASGMWIDRCNQVVDRIFVTSEHALKSLADPTYTMMNAQQQAVGNLKLETPVDVISYPYRDLKLDKTLQKKLKIKSKFNFLMVAQSGPRKNLFNSISWFLEEFQHNEEVGLVIKAHHMNNSAMDRFNLAHQISGIIKQNFEDKKCKIYLLHGNLTDEEMSSLYIHSDIHAFVTATHGEGFGLPIFEAACRGLPVVAAPWSGYTDFLYADVVNEVSGKSKRTPMFTKVKYEVRQIQPDAVWKDVLEEDSQWCFPDGGDFRKMLRKTYEIYTPKKKIADQLKDILCEKLEEKKMFAQVVECINKVLPEDMGELEDWFEQFNDSVVVND